MKVTKVIIDHLNNVIQQTNAQIRETMEKNFPDPEGSRYSNRPSEAGPPRCLGAQYTKPHKLYSTLFNYFDRKSRNIHKSDGK